MIIIAVSLITGNRHDPTHVYNTFLTLVSGPSLYMLTLLSLASWFIPIIIRPQSWQPWFRSILVYVHVHNNLLYNNYYIVGTESPQKFFLRTRVKRESGKTSTQLHALQVRVADSLYTALPQDILVGLVTVDTNEYH